MEHRLFGVSQETESSWEDCLGAAHLAFVLDFVNRRQADEEAAIAKFHAECGTEPNSP